MNLVISKKYRTYSLARKALLDKTFNSYISEIKNVVLSSKNKKF